MPGIAGFFAILFSLAAASAQSNPPPAQITPNEIEQAKKVVQTFCAYWKAQKYDSMYAMMCKTTQADMPKAKFIKVYKVMPDNKKNCPLFQ